MSEENFQTRSAENGLRFFKTFAEAHAHAKEDTTVWKISFDLSTGERIRLVRFAGEFLLQQMDDAIAAVKFERNKT